MTDRGSTTHSPRVDDELAQHTRSLTQGSPVEARNDEARMMEPPGDGEPLPDTHPPVDDVELRSRIAASLRPSAFPADREALVAVALDEGADPEIVEWLRGLPGGTDYPTMSAIWQAIGGTSEGPWQPEPVLAEPVLAEPVLAEPVAAAPPPVADDEEREAEEPEPGASPSVVERVAGVAVGVVELAVGAAVTVVQRVRRRVGV